MSFFGASGCMTAAPNTRRDCFLWIVACRQTGRIILRTFLFSLDMLLSFCTELQAALCVDEGCSCVLMQLLCTLLSMSICTGPDARGCLSKPHMTDANGELKRFLEQQAVRLKIYSRLTVYNNDGAVCECMWGWFCRLWKLQ